MDVLFNQARADNFIEGVVTASGLQSMATLIQAEQVARSEAVKLAIFSKKYEMSRVVDLVFKMDRENKAKSET